MTKKELNKIKTTVFDFCIEMMTKKDLTVFDGGNKTAHLFEISEHGQREWIWVSCLSQINTNMMAKYGFTENATVEHLITLNKKTKCADFINLK